MKKYYYLLCFLAPITWCCAAPFAEAFAADNVGQNSAISMPGIHLTPQEQTWIKDHPVIRYAGDPSWIPFDFVDERGNHSGFAHDVIKRLESLLGIHFERIPGLTWKKSLEKAKNRQLDLISLASQTPERERYLSFTQPVISMPWVIATRDNFRPVKGIDDLTRDRIVVAEGYAIISYIRRHHPKVTFREVASPLEGLKQVSLGQADAYIGYVGIIAHLVKAHVLVNVKLAAYTEADITKVRMGVRSDWPVLTGLLEKGLDAISQAEMNAMQEQWSPSLQNNIPVDHTDEENTWILAGICFVVVLFFLSAALLLPRVLTDSALVRHLSSRRLQSLILSVTALIFILVLSMVWYALANSRHQTTSQVKHKLFNTFQNNLFLLTDWANDKRTHLSHIGKGHTLISLVQQIIEPPKAAVAQHRLAIRQKIQNYFSRISALTGHIEYAIVLPDGSTMASATGIYLDKQHPIAVQAKQRMALVMKGESLFIPPTENSDPGINGTEVDHDIYLAVPIKGADGKPVAVLLQRFTTNGHLSRLLRTGYPQRSGESYMLDRQGHILTESRFTKKLYEVGLLSDHHPKYGRLSARDPGRNLMQFAAPLPQGERNWPLTRMAKDIQALAADMENAPSTKMHSPLGFDLAGYRNYRGASVVGVWAWNRQLDLGMTTELEVAEAYHAHETLTFNLMIISALTLLLSSSTILLTLTLSRRATRYVQRARDELEQRVHERTNELYRAKDQAESASMAKSNFLATMSHEVRTPINAILGLCELLRKTDLSATQKRYFDSMHSTSKSLFVLLNNVLDFSRIEAGELALEPTRFSLHALVEDVLLVFRPAAEEQGIGLLLNRDPDLPDQVHGDATHLRQVLINLVGNAVKFTEQGSVRLDLQRMEQDEENRTSTLRFEIIDTGIGIRPEDQALLFRPFSQVEQTSQHQLGGTGLGLVISKELIQLMGGTIALESHPREGTAVSFTLKFKNATMAHGMPRHDATVPVSGSTPLRRTSSTILLVEDEPITQMVTSELLREAGYTIILANNGQEALDLFTTQKVDLILMDLRMPDMNGLEATKLIRRREQQRGRAPIPIFGLTADVVSTTFEACRAAGMDQVLTKPVDPPTLEQKIRIVESQ